MTRRLIVWSLALVASVAAAGAVRSSAAFTATSSTPVNSFATAETFGGTTVATGTYAGNGIDNRAITGIGFEPDVVLIKGAGSQAAVIRTSAQSGDVSKAMTTAAQASNQIQSLIANGFTLGTAATVNSNGVPYQWLALLETPGVVDIGTYTGNGASSRVITGTGFSPEYVTVIPATAQAPVERFEAMSSSFRFDRGAGATARINSLDSDGFTLGNNAAVNGSGSAYTYLAVNEVPGVEIGSYTGNGGHREITGVGFRPDFLNIRNAGTTSRRGIWRTAPVNGDSSLSFSATANAANLIEEITSDGFRLGSDANVNANGIVHHYLAIRD